jgi:hypothetical protein
VLYDIFDDINYAYTKFNKNEDNIESSLRAREFLNNQEVDEYVQSKNYLAEGMLCMSYGFD